MDKLKELKESGVKVVILNGFRESLSYVMSLGDVKYSDETVKSYDGYSEYHCFETN
jgi:hypothetical protein